MAAFSIEMPKQIEKNDEDLRQIRQYLVRLVTRLIYTLNSLDGDNFMDGSIGAAKFKGGAAGILEAATAKLGTAEIGKATVQHLQAQVAQMVTAVIRTGVIDWASIGRLQAAIAQIADAEIGTAKIDWAQIYDLVADEAIIRKGLGEKLYIDRLAVNSAQMVELTVGQLVVKAQDGSYYALDVDITDGTVTAREVEVTEGEIAQGQTTSGRHIIESDLTVAELNCSTAMMTEALISKLTAARIDADSLFAREAIINALTAGEIAGVLGASLDLTSNDSIRLIIKDRIDEIEVGGRNLLTGTTREETPITATEALDKVDTAELGDGWDGWLTFRTYIRATDGDWVARIRLTDPEDTWATLGDMILGEAVLGAGEATQADYDSEPIAAGTEGWATVTVKAPYGRVRAQAMIVGTGNASYHSAKMESGNKPTQWTPAPEEVEELINHAADPAMEELARLSENTTTLLKAMNGTIDATVEKQISLDNGLNRLIALVGALEVRAGELEMRAEAGGLGTNMLVQPDKVLIRQKQEQNWELWLTAELLSFVNTTTGKAAAEFGPNGAIVDRLRSLSLISVGSDETGWYDFITLASGMADKWRDGTQTVKPAIITGEPEDPVIAWVSGTHSINGSTAWPEGFLTFGHVEAENATGYQWQWRLLYSGDAWTNFSSSATSATTDTLQLTVSALSMAREYRCVVTGADGHTVASRAIRPRVEGAPLLLKGPGDGDVLSGTEFTLYAAGAASYQTQYKETQGGTTWTAGSTKTEPVFSVQTPGRFYRWAITDTDGRITFTETIKCVSA